MNYAGTHHLNLARSRSGNVRYHSHRDPPAFRNPVPGSTMVSLSRYAAPVREAAARHPEGRRAFLRLLTDFRFASFEPDTVRGRAQIPIARQRA